MPLKKQTFKDDEEMLYDDAVIYKRVSHSEFRLGLLDPEIRQQTIAHGQ